MRSVAAVGVRSVAAGRARYALTGVAIVLGVAASFSVLVSAASVNRGFDRFAADFTGRADVIAGANGSGDAALPAEAVAAAAALDGVAEAVGVVAFGTNVDVGEEDPEWMAAQGVDLDAARRIRDFPLAAGRFFADAAPEVVLPRSHADRLGVVVGEPLSVATPTGRHELTLVGLLDDDGAGRFQGGRVAYVSLPVGRMLSGRGAGVDRIDIDLATGVAVDDWLDAHQEALGPAVVLADGESIGDGFRSFLNAIQTAFGATAALALLVGTFLIYLTFTVSVVEQRRLFGVLRAIGATPEQVRRVVLAQATALAVVSSAVGLVVGLGLAALLVRVFATASDIPVPPLTVPPAAVAAAVAVGVLTTLASAYVPARRAGRVSPIEAMRDLGDTTGERSRVWVAGAVLVGLGVAVALRESGGNIAIAGLGAVLLGAILLVPAVLGPLARVSGTVTAPLGRGVGAIAVMHLVKERSRSAYTLGLMMVVFASVLGIGAANVSMRSSLDDVVRRQFGADLTAWAPNVFDPVVDDQLRGVEGVEAVTPLRWGELRHRDRAGDERGFPLLLVDPATYFDVQGIAWVEGDDTRGRAALARGGAIVVPTLLADQLGVGVGGAVEVRTAEGWRPFVVAGTYASMGVGIPVYASAVDGALLGSGRANGYAMALGEGIDPEQAAARVRHAIGPATGAVVDTFAEVKAESEAILAGYFNIGYGILVLVAGVGVLGLANTLAVSVIQRRREIGILRALGTSRAQVRGLVSVESATLVLVAFVLSLPLGLVVSRLLIRMFADGFGFTLDEVVPVGMVPIVLLVAGVLAVVAAVLPARRAARLEVTESLVFG